jgi:adenylate cyclase
LNKEYGSHILLSETTYVEVQDPMLVFRELDLIRVKGKLQPVTLYELLGTRGTPEGDTPDLEERIEMFSQGRVCSRERRWRMHKLFLRSCWSAGRKMAPHACTQIAAGNIT